tara:strand:- start:103 stop:459 length:357 start_codon:yes stop_codon:yes gene_type:complete
MKALIIKDTRDNEVTIFLSDGGVSSIHDTGEYFLAEYYQSRIDLDQLEDEGYEFWEELAEGKMYCKEYPVENVTEKMIDECINWLGGIEEGEGNKKTIETEDADEYWNQIKTFLQENN